MQIVWMHITTFDQLLCDNELQEGDNSGKGYCLRMPMEHVRDKCGSYVGHTRRISKSDYFTTNSWSTGMVSEV